MAVKKPTTSKRKIDQHAQVQALDRRAKELQGSGLGRDEAYKRAADEILK